MSPFPFSKLAARIKTKSQPRPSSPGSIQSRQLSLFSPSAPRYRRKNTPSSVQNEELPISWPFQSNHQTSSIPSSRRPSVSMSFLATELSLPQSVSGYGHGAASSEGDDDMGRKPSTSKLPQPKFSPMPSRYRNLQGIDNDDLPAKHRSESVSFQTSPFPVFFSSSANGGQGQKQRLFKREM